MNDNGQTETRWGAPMRRPWRTLVFAGVLAGIALWGALQLKLDPSIEALFDRDNPAGKALLSLASDFASADDLLVLIEVQTPEAMKPEARAHRLIQVAEHLEKALLDQDPEHRQIASITWRADSDETGFASEVVMPSLAWYLDEAGFEALRQRLSVEGMTAQIRKDEVLVTAPSPAGAVLAREVLRDPLRLHDLAAPVMRGMRPDLRTWRDEPTFMNSDARALLMRVSGARPAADGAFTQLLMTTVRSALESVDTKDTTVHLGGAYAIAETAAREIRADMGRSIISSIILLQILFLLGYRNRLAFVAAAVPVGLGVLAGFGVSGWLGIGLTPVTAVGGAILAGLGVDYGVHYLSHRQVHGAADQASLSGLVRALFAACFTSVIAFGAVGFSSVPALQSFAMLGAVGLGVSVLATLTVLPALLRLTERKNANWQGRFNAEPLMAKLDQSARIVLGVSLLLVVLCVWPAVMRLTDAHWFDTNASVMHPQPNPALELPDRIATYFGGSPYSLMVHLEANDPVALLDRAQRAHRALDQASIHALGLRAPYGVSNLLPFPHDQRQAAIHALNPDQVIADFRTVLNGSLFDPEAFGPYEQFLRRLLRPDVSPGLNVLSHYPKLARAFLPRAAFADQPATQALTLIPLNEGLAGHEQRRRVIDGVRAALQPVEGATLTGLPVLSHDAQYAVRHDLGLLFAVAGVLIVIWLWMVFRSGWAILGALIPVMVAGLCVLAGMQWFDARLNLINVIALPLLVGIAVDDGIFLVAGAQAGGDQGRRALGGSVHAVTMTSLSTALAFGSLSLTSVPAIQSLGALMAAGVTAGWFGAMFILMPILLIITRRPTAGYAS